jgi:hypothetical protein
MATITYEVTVATGTNGIVPTLINIILMAKLHPYFIYKKVIPISSINLMLLIQVIL